MSFRAARRLNRALESLTPRSQPTFFDARADRLLDELPGICFTENMKSMEKYYRWASEAYCRDRKGLYLAAHPTFSLKSDF